MGVGEECVLVHPQIPELRTAGSPEAGVTELIDKPPLMARPGLKTKGAQVIFMSPSLLEW